MISHHCAAARVFTTQSGSIRARNVIRTRLSLVELLEVITSIGMLLEMLFPAVQLVREMAICLNNMRPIAFSAHNFEGARQDLPTQGAIELLATTAMPDLQDSSNSLSLVDRNDIASRWDERERRDSSIDNDGEEFGNAVLTQMEIQPFRCPTMNPPSLQFVDDRVPCSCLVSVGTQDVALLCQVVCPQL